MSDLNALFIRIRSIMGKKRKQQTSELPKELPSSQKEAVVEQKGCALCWYPLLAGATFRGVCVYLKVRLSCNLRRLPPFDSFN